jgi:hypothetical protein
MTSISTVSSSRASIFDAFQRCLRYAPLYLSIQLASFLGRASNGT